MSGAAWGPVWFVDGFVSVLFCFVYSWMSLLAYRCGGEVEALLGVVEESCGGDWVSCGIVVVDGSKFAL